MIKLPNITGIVKVGRTFLLANRPEILLGAALTSAVGGAILAAKGGYEARGIVDEERTKRFDANPDSPIAELEPTVKEKIQLTWLCYVPAAVAVTTSIGSISGLHLVHVKEKKALATAALAAIEEVKKEAKAWEKEVTEAMTPEERKDVQERLYEKSYDPESGVSKMQNSDGEIEEFYLVRDGKTGRDIWSNQHRIESAIIEVNNVLNGSDSVELNHFYHHAGFASTPDGSKQGWSGALVDIEWGVVVRDDGRPTREFTFRPQPSKGYDSANG